MDNFNRLVFFFILAIAANACDDSVPGEDDIGIYLDKVLADKKERREIEHFTIPDSINVSLIVATYFEPDPKGHSIIIYSDSGRKEALKIKYLSDSTTTSDKLIKTTNNPFRSIFNKGEYIVNPGNVVYSYSTSANVTAMEEFERTDIIH